MTDYTDPEHWKTLRFRKEQRDDEFRKGLIGEPTYILSLQFLGYLTREAQTEANLIKMDMRR